jgi:serine protease Do
MKTFIQFLSAGAIGGLVVFFGLKGSDPVPSDNSSQPRATLVNMNSSPSMIAPTVDFVEASKKTTSSVVHIFAEESETLAMQNRRKQRSSDPFEDFWGFDNFFSNNFYQQPKNGTGSGVIYDSQGHIVTNNHVVGFADKIVVTLADGKKYNAHKIGADPATDLAVIKIDDAKNLVPIHVGNSENVQVGEWVLAVGNPFGYLTSTVTAGIVSAKGRSLNVIEDKKKIEEFIQTDAVINPGNSGGALVNAKGDLIGINTAIATPTGVFAGYSFAIPTKIMDPVVKNIITNGEDITPKSLGIGGYDVDDDLVKEFGLNLKQNRGFYVQSTDRGSSAQFGGLIPGDVIIGIDDQAIKNYDDIQAVMRLTKIGQNIKVKINRDGKEMSLPINLKRSM